MPGTVVIFNKFAVYEGDNEKAGSHNFSMKVLCIGNDRVLKTGASNTLKGQKRKTTCRLRPEGREAVVPVRVRARGRDEQGSDGP